MDIAMVTGIATLICALYSGDFSFNKQGELRFIKRLVHFPRGSHTELLYLLPEHEVDIYKDYLENVNHSANIF